MNRGTNQRSARTNFADSAGNMQGLIEHAVDKSPEAVFFVKADARFVYVNDTACRSLGYTREELLGMRVFDVDLDFGADQWESLWRGIKTASLSVLESRMRRKDGGVVAVELRTSYLEFDGVDLCCVYARDIRKRKLAKDERGSLLTKMQEQLSRLDAVREMALAITATLDLSAVLDTLFEKIDLLPYPAATIRLFDSETDQLNCVRCHNLNEIEWQADTESLQRGLTKIVFETGQVVVSEDVRSDPRTVNPHLVIKHGLVSFLGLPLVVRGSRLGVLSFYTKRRHEFTPDEIEFLSLISAQAAVAISNSQLYEETKQNTARLAAANQQLAALYEITSAASQSLDLDSVLQQVIRKITEIFQFATTRVFLFDGAMEVLNLRASFEREPELWTRIRSFKKGEGLVGQVAESGEAVVYEDATTDPRYELRSKTKNVTTSQHSFFALCPIKSRSQTWGTILCIGREPRKLTTDELQLITSMANQIGIAVENANLFEETRGRADQLSTLYSLATVLNQTLDVESMLRGAMHEILEIFDFEAGRIYLLSEDSEELELLLHEGFPEGLPVPRRYRRGEGVVGHVFERGVPSFFADVRQDPSFSQLATRSVLMPAGYICQFFIPIRVKAQGIGVINIVSKEIHSFSDKEVQLMDAIANQVGIAIEHSSLFRQLQHRSNELESLNIELQEANRVRTDFVNAMSHELRTPLTATIGYTGLLLDGFGGDLTKVQAESLENISHQSGILLKLISDILTLGQLEAGKTTLNVSAAPLDEMFRHVRAYASQLEQQNGPRMCWAIEDDLPLLQTDYVKLEEILQNLIGNAYKFTAEGEVTVRVRDLPSEGCIEFIVEDTGMGIDVSEAHRVFDPFHQSAEAHKGNLAGVGLGLSIVKKYLDLMKGRIYVESSRGRGSRFVFTLPYAI